MPPTPHDRIAALALHIALGGTLRAWAAGNDVSERSCFRWSARPGFKARVAAIRGDLLRSTLGELILASRLAAGELRRIIGPHSTASDAIKVRACQVVLAARIDHAAFDEVDARIAEIEARLPEAGPKPGARPGANRWEVN